MSGIRLKPILAVFRKSDGKFMDSEDSYAHGASESVLILGANVIGTYGGTKSDYICIPVDEKDVHLFKYVDQRLVPDVEKLTAIQDRKDEAQMKKDEFDGLKSKLKDDSITFTEVKRLLALFLKV